MSFQNILCLLEHADTKVGFQIILSISSDVQSVYFFYRFPDNADKCYLCVVLLVISFF
jgi:hypothetical protein